MFDKIYHIQEIRDDKNGEGTVNSLLKKVELLFLLSLR